MRLTLGTDNDKIMRWLVRSKEKIGTHRCKPTFYVLVCYEYKLLIVASLHIDLLFYLQINTKIAILVHRSAYTRDRHGKNVICLLFEVGRKCVENKRMLEKERNANVAITRFYR